MAQRKFYVDININGYELKDFVVYPLATAPASPKQGQIYFNTTDKKLYYYNNSAWIPGTNISAQNKVADASGNYGTFNGAIGDTWYFRNIKAKSGKILITLSAGGEIEIDASITKSDVGLGNVDNVQQIPMTQKGANDGVATLGSDGKVPSSQLPSYVDDIIEIESIIGTLAGMTIGKYYYYTVTKKIILATSPTAGNSIDPEASKIYVDLSTNKTYRWSGSDLIVISDTLALGETAQTAYRGDLGKIAYDHSQLGGSATAPHISDAERTTWNAKQSTDVTISSPSASDTQASAGVNNITNLFQIAVNNIKALFDKFNVSTGHDHDGTDSKKVDFSNLTGKEDITKRKIVTGLTGLTGNIPASTHGCGIRPIVKFYQGLEEIELSVILNASGDITWSSNKDFVAGDSLEAVIIGV